MIAALYVQTGGAYYGIEDVDPWDETRDARLYDGPHPVVAHPPCARWCQLAALHGYAIGDDGGCFEAALRAVRTYGGVLEHPAHSIAWDHFGLPEPARYGWAGGPSALWTRTGRDLARARDLCRCRCRGIGCRDREVTREEHHSPST